MYNISKILFFGLDYKGALYDFTLIAGKMSLPPKYTFGVFYSRYWAYNDIGQMVKVLDVIFEYLSTVGGGEGVS